jgi:hypothetical protein
MTKLHALTVSNYKKTVSKRTIKFIQNSRSERIKHSLYSKKDLITTFVNKFKQTEHDENITNPKTKLTRVCAYGMLQRIQSYKSR